ncbi:MAG: 5-carboxymethyl-2-hydroxymuconate isomerase [Bacilli bacterium]|nr:5-carboxymethyl-2-hydroxymuconate isomerase [Bacilli bacterium]
MKLLNFIMEGKYRLGVKTERGIVDVETAISVVTNNGDIVRTMHEAIEGGREALYTLQSFIDQALAETESSIQAKYLLNEEEISFGACVPYPNKIICVGLNYRKHAEETNSLIPEYPILFSKFNNTLNGHGSAVLLPKVSKKVDYEAELAIVIGKKSKDVEKEVALNCVFGYCNANDLSARDLQSRTNQWLLGKTCDGFSPIGPYLVTSDEIGDPNQLEIRCLVNGEVRQQSNTADMIFRCEEIVSYISQHFTLEPGDIILTGTPEGVVLGYPEDKQFFLKDGDVVTIEIEKLGRLTNHMISEI